MFILLRPLLLGYKNRLLEKTAPGRHLNSEAVMVLFSAVSLAGIYLASRIFLLGVRFHPELSRYLPEKLIGLLFLAFFLLLLFSNFVSALNVFYAASDLPLLLIVPVSRFRLFLARFIESLLGASWLCGLFGLPLLLAYRDVFQLSWMFVVHGLICGTVFLVAPAAIGAAAATIFVNLVPVARLSDFLTAAVFGGIAVILFLQQSSPSPGTTEAATLRLAHMLAAVEQPSSYLLPSRWAADVLATYFRPHSAPRVVPYLYLVGGSLLSFAAAFLSFEFWFDSGWSAATEQRRTGRGRRQGILGVFRLALPLEPQKRALIVKEYRMFLRDVSQSLQMILILLLTFLYIYNFRSVHNFAHGDDITRQWWQAVLALANISMGSCVAAAIATRFVYPSVSLEGRAYVLLRAAPISVARLLQIKQHSWLMPMALILCVLVLSGGLAIQLSPAGLLMSTIVAFAIAYGIVGLGVGLGAVYVRFDWDSPVQVTSSFGSLVYMMLSFVLIAVSVMLAGGLFFLTAMTDFSFARGDILITLVSSLTLVFFLNLMASRTALRAGEQTLLDLER